MGKLLRPVWVWLCRAPWWIAFLVLATLASAAVLAFLAWALERPGDDFWPRVSAYWLSRHAAPFWLSTLVLELAGALLAAPLTWPPRRRELQSVPLGCFLAGVAYAAIRFLRQGLTGTPFLGQAAAFWPDVVGLGLSLAAGAFVALGLLRWAWPSSGQVVRPWRDSRRPRRT